MRNKVVVHYLDGHIIKGATLDFVPTKESFHLFDAEDEKKVSQIVAKDLKAVFFVKSYAGNPTHKRRAGVEEAQKAPGRKLRIAFVDGEVMVGTAAAYVPGRGGFFLIPADPVDNNERVYIYTHATKSIETLKPSVAV